MHGGFSVRPRETKRMRKICRLDIIELKRCTTCQDSSWWKSSSAFEKRAEILLCYRQKEYSITKSSHLMRKQLCLFEYRKLLDWCQKGRLRWAWSLGIAWDSSHTSEVGADRSKKAISSLLLSMTIYLPSFGPHKGIHNVFAHLKGSSSIEWGPSV